MGSEESDMTELTYADTDTDTHTHTHTHTHKGVAKCKNTFKLLNFR